MSMCVKAKGNTRHPSLTPLHLMLWGKLSQWSYELTNGLTSWPEISSNLSIRTSSVLESQAQVTPYSLRSWNSDSDYFAGVTVHLPPSQPLSAQMCVWKIGRVRGPLGSYWLRAYCVNGTAPCLAINAKSSNDHQICPVEFTPSNLVQKTSPTCHALCMATVSLRWAHLLCYHCCLLALKKWLIQNRSPGLNGLLPACMFCLQLFNYPFPPSIILTQTLASMTCQVFPCLTAFILVIP